MLFLAKISNSNVFSAQKQVISKKKTSSSKLEGFFCPKSQIQTFFSAKTSNFFLPTKFRVGQERKSEKRKAPPAPPLATRLAWGLRTSSKFNKQKFKTIHRSIGSLETPKQARLPSSTKQTFNVMKSVRIIQHLASDAVQ